ncbi:competence protein ComEA [Bifidobacterium callitrichos]|nr:competence protein ComEA [Bifidobacterium callitrichos]
MPSHRGGMGVYHSRPGGDPRPYESYVESYAASDDGSRSPRSSSCSFSSSSRPSMASVPLPPRPVGDGSPSSSVIPDFGDIHQVAAEPVMSGTLSEDAIDRTQSQFRSLSRLTGVHGEDMDGDDFERRAKHGKPRLKFTATHALAAILIMTFVTCVSLTLLIHQSVNYAALGRAGDASKTVDQASPGSEGGETGGDASDGDTGTDANTDGQPDSSSQSQNSGGTTLDSGGQTASGDSASSAVPTPAPAPAPDPTDTRVDLNTATLEQLDSIPGIGPVTAQKILDHRRKIGRFTSVDQLLDVSGIGAKTLEKIRPGVKV